MIFAMEVPGNWYTGLLEGYLQPNGVGSVTFLTWDDFRVKSQKVNFSDLGIEAKGRLLHLLIRSAFYDDKCV